VGYENASQTPLLRSEHVGSPSEAADDAGHGARMQIRTAIQEPARISWQKFRSDIYLDIQFDGWDIPLDNFKYSVG
jgi:hypothetical protein